MDVLVSVIIPVFNAEKSIVSTLKSVLEQSHKCYEIVIINDGSTDRSAELAEDYLSNASVDYKIIHQFNKGVSIARNNGIYASKGKYIAFLDSDDRWYPEKLEKQLNLVEQYDFVCCDRFNGKTASGHKTIRFSNLFIKNPICTSTVLINKGVLMTTGVFNPNYRYCEDLDLWFRILLKTPCCMICEKLVAYGTNDSKYNLEGLSSKLITMEKGELRVLYGLYSNGDIVAFKWVIASIWSLLKFIRRAIIVQLYRVIAFLKSKK